MISERRTLTLARRNRISRLATAMLRSRRGMSLIELIIGLAIASLIAGAAVVAIHQILTASAQANDMQLVNSQVRAAEHWMTRDILSTGSAEDDLVCGGTAGLEPLILKWHDISGVPHRVEYSLEPMPSSDLWNLVRSHWVTNVDPNLYDPQSRLAVASYIVYDDAALASDRDQSLSWALEPEGADTAVLEVSLVAEVRSHIATRQFQAMPRAS
ncbi:MAG: prepilin-type N-terminal cleavage/methylation domain-containing protein [Dehalococcoidia bacterium]|nr:prepilin-type N-terminal cleavage/methylation domain-containing protein [Dehalococcoidia bacterium]